MKLITTLILNLILLISFNFLGFSQSKNEKINLNIQKIEKNDNSNIYNSLLEDSRKEKLTQKEDFVKAIENFISIHKENTVVFFDKKFSQKEIDEVYSELYNPMFFTYNTKTISFIKYWRSKRRDLKMEYKKLLMEYQ